MSWVTVLWSMVTAACLTLAGVHGLVWVRQRSARANLTFALLAIGTAALAACELGMMRAGGPREYGVWQRWFHLPVWLCMVALATFIRLHLQSGRAWLMWTIIGIRTLTLGINFLSPVNVNYREILRLEWIPLFGERVAVPVGVPNPWMALAQLSLVLLLVQAVDAAWTAWRRGERRSAWIVGGSTIVFVSVGTVQAILVYWGWVTMPITVSPFFTGLIMAMGYELSSRVLRAADLARALQEREADLRRERALTDAVFDSVPGLLYLYTAEGRLVRWNRQHETRTGYTTEEMAGRRAEDWFEASDLPALRAAWSQAFAGGSVAIELPLRLRDGTRVPYLLTGVRVLIDGCPHLVGVGIDITPLRAAEEEAARRRAELAHLSRVASLNELSGSLAHELNQPLAIILSNAQAAQRLLLREPPDLAEVRDILADIVAEDLRAGEVIRRLRALLRRAEPEIQPLSVNDVVRDVAALMRRELVGRGVDLGLELSPELPRIAGDRVALQQVLLNLVSNSCDAMAGQPPGGRRLTIATGSGGGEVQISVRDTGCGLPAEAERIFDSFFTSKAQGVGMGLAICRTLVQAHRGRIWAEPNSDRGATLRVSLPRLEEPA